MQKSMDEESKKNVSFGGVRIHGHVTRTEGQYSKEKQASLPVSGRSRLESPTVTKSMWQVFMFGFGTAKFPAKMELSEIKNRQLRQQTTMVSGEGEEEEQREHRKSGKKRWWRFIDVFGCHGRGEYDGDKVEKDLRASFPTLRKFD